MLVLSLSGCIQSHPNRLYLLRAQPGESVAVESAAPQAVGRVIGIGPVYISDYLDRSEIVRRVGPNELELAEFHQWAQPLDVSISDVVAHNLRTRLGAGQVLAFPWATSLSPDVVVRLDVRQFDADSPGNVTLDADITITGLDKREVSVGHYRATVESQGSSFADVARAHSNALADLSARIARDLLEPSEKNE
jgi:uncharacterized lipoprotein YmbA